MNSIHAIYKTIKEFVVDLYSEPSLMDAVVLQDTKKEHEGDITLITFSIVKFTKENPVKTANDIGDYLLQNLVCLNPIMLKVVS